MDIGGEQSTVHVHVIFQEKGEFIYLYDSESLSCCVVVDEAAIRNSNY